MQSSMSSVEASKNLRGPTNLMYQIDLTEHSNKKRVQNEKNSGKMSFRYQAAGKPSKVKPLFENITALNTSYHAQESTKKT